MACVLTGCLFIFSLAGVVRYHYFSIYMLTLSVPFALRIAAAWLKEWQGREALTDAPPLIFCFQYRGLGVAF